MLFKYAIDLEIVSTNYASLVELPPKEQSEIHQPFTSDELKILWQNANDACSKIGVDSVRLQVCALLNFCKLKLPMLT